MIEKVLTHFNNSQADLARQLDVDRSAISQWVAEDKIPPLRAIQIEKLTGGKIKAVDLVKGV